MNFFDASFWQSFLSNLFATLIGVVLGIPIAFWINRRVEVTTEIEKKNKILTMLSVELNKNRTVLADWQDHRDDHIKIRLYGAWLSDEVWNAFSINSSFDQVTNLSIVNLNGHGERPCPFRC